MKNYISLLIAGLLLPTISSFADTPVSFTKENLVKSGSTCIVGSISGDWEGSPCEKFYGPLMTESSASVVTTQEQPIVTKPAGTSIYPTTKDASTLNR